MKKALLLFLLVPAMISLNSCGGKKEKYKSEDGGFAVAFLGEPKKTQESVPTEIGAIEIIMFMHEANAQEVYIVSYSDYPEALIQLSNGMDLLKGAQGGVVGNIGGNISDEKESEFQGNPALDFRAAGDQYNLAYKLILKGNRLYQIGIMKDGIEISDSEIQDFIGSFELI